MRILPLLLSCCVMPLFAQTLTQGLEQTYELQSTVSSGNTPLWLNANRYGLSSLRSGNGYVRGCLERPLVVDSLKDWGMGYGADLAVPYHFTSHFVIQQLYAEGRYRRLVLTLGQKQQPMELKNQQLSSGSQTLGINARPVPGLRLSIPDYWNVPGLNHWMALKGHVFYGWMTDGTFQEDWTGGETRYATKVKLHTKAGYLRIGPEKEHFPLNLELGLEMACEFGGTLYHTQYGTIEAASGAKAYWDAFVAGGSDEVDPTYHNVGGNQLGSWVARLNYHSSLFDVSLYCDHFFEDHSSMLFLDYDGYGKGTEWNARKENQYLLYPLKDMLVGLEIKAPKFPWVNDVIFEFINTRYQSGPIYHDHNEGISDHIGGDDNYYNHYLYQGWSHWGQVIGNPLYRSPIYNSDGTLTIQDNRFRAWHLGLGGEIPSFVQYRLLATYQQGYGTYQNPYLSVPQNNLSLMAEATYRFVRLAVGVDHGELLGNNLGVQLSLVYHLSR